MPEISDGLVEIVGVAREPGYRSKISVVSHSDGVDPVGACVGPRGSRVRMVVSELRGEKIDIIPFDQEPARFVAKSLSPARVREVLLDDEQREATVVVPDDQLSLAIGKDGQNARLANRLTGWKIDIKSETEMNEEDNGLRGGRSRAGSGRWTVPRADCRRQTVPERGLDGESILRYTFASGARVSARNASRRFMGMDAEHSCCAADVAMPTRHAAYAAVCRLRTARTASGFLRLSLDVESSPPRVVTRLGGT